VVIESGPDPAATGEAGIWLGVPEAPSMAYVDKRFVEALATCTNRPEGSAVTTF
jgi:hypothetical protein